jgi:hypothetical protein
MGCPIAFLLVRRLLDLLRLAPRPDDNDVEIRCAPPSAHAAMRLVTGTSNGLRFLGQAVRAPRLTRPGAAPLHRGAGAWPRRPTLSGLVDELADLSIGSVSGEGLSPPNPGALTPGNLVRLRGAFRCLPGRQGSRRLPPSVFVSQLLLGLERGRGEPSPRELPILQGKSVQIETVMCAASQGTEREENLAEAQFSIDAGRKHAEQGRRLARQFIEQLKAELSSGSLPAYAPKHPDLPATGRP